MIECWCRKCHEDELIHGFPWMACNFVVCPICGCKRCPHSDDHDQECTGTDENGAHSCSGCIENQLRMAQLVHGFATTNVEGFDPTVVKDPPPKTFP